MEHEDIKKIIRVAPDVHKRAKMLAMDEDMTLEKFVTKLINGYKRRKK